MKRFFIAAIAAAAAVAGFAQQQPAADAAAQKVVAVINGETITAGKLDQLYNSMNPLMRAQYDQNGGKLAFLDNYIKKHLLVQEAIKSGFDKRPEVQTAMSAASESALFDRYVRDVVAAPFVKDEDEQKYYADHPNDFQQQEMVKAYHIVLLTTGAHAMSKAEAADKIARIAVALRETAAQASQLDPAAARTVLLNAFKEQARQNSQDGSAPSGGDLGWFPRGKMDPAFEKAAFDTPVGTVSPVVQSQFGYHLIYVEDKKPGGVMPFAAVKDRIRETLLAQHTAEIMGTVARMTQELRTTGKVSVQSQNVQ